jgi:putative membrane protein
MRTLRRLLAIVLAIIVIVFGVLFSLQNQTLVTVDLLLPQVFQQTTAFWVLASFAAGVLLSLVVFSLLFLQAQQRNVRLNLKVNALRRQLAKLEADARGS